MDNQRLIKTLDVPFTFTLRPTPIAPEFRPEWRLPLLLLAIRKCCRGGRSSLRRLHVLNWTLRSARGQAQLFSALAKQAPARRVVIRLEPSLNRAIAFAVGEHLLTFSSGDHVELTPAGRSLADEADQLSDCYRNERTFLENLGHRLTEAWVTHLMRDLTVG